ncbi:MAG: DNA polymerase III subunit gamma/tau [Planctomycetaceae bacterium]
MSTGSHYTVLARRFRPQAFDDVVGQEHVSKALRNAIRAGRVAHAYLFTGARGVGKTSTARILAKALNCPNAKDGVPCNNCEICDGVSAGNDVDVMEIDGASNTGVDNIRSLRANVGVRSMRAEFKIYIIDEVHMLSTAAFNALLKTLEEPPPNVKFVFCTTEPQKVPDTILSRCQRFDFSAINDQSIADRLKEIATAEGFDVADEAVELVARRARGSMRDSQSLFDQLLAFSEGSVTAEDVHRMLGTASDDLLISLFAAVVEHRPGEVLTLLESALNAGVQAGELLDQCIGYVRDLMVLLSGGVHVPLCSVASARRDELQTHGNAMSMPNVLAAFQILSEAKSRMFRSTFSRVVLEMAMVQLTLLENLSALSSLLSGELPGIPAAVAGTVADSGSNSPEKKTPEFAGQAAEPADGTRSPSPKIEFCQQNVNQILTELIAESGLQLGGALKEAAASISLPNRLELSIGSSYSSRRRILEQPETRTTIVSLVERLTGIEPVVSIVVVDDRTDAASPSSEPAPVKTAERIAEPSASKSGRPAVARTKSSPVRRRDDIDPEKDAFVQQVVDVFGATVVQVVDAPARSGTAAEADD